MIEDLLNDLPNNKEIFNSFVVTTSKLKNINYENVLVAVSGGSDSDILLDIIHKCDRAKKAKYIWFDTGLEYRATKEHLKYLENKYDIKIIISKPIKPIPTCCKEYGQPFMSKLVSEYMSRLQAHNFKWEDRPFEELHKEYPNCKVALKWWCNENGEGSRFNIERNRHLKEFIIKNPPQFRISNKCCKYAKKEVAKKYKKENNIDLSIIGVRKSEGGARASAYKNCFSSNDGVSDEYRPIFWYKEDTKRDYEKHFNVKHSDCYDVYGLKRTGCAGCPYGKEFEFELEVIKKYETKLYKAVNNIFKDTYEYTRKYNEFRKNEGD